MRPLSNREISASMVCLIAIPYRATASHTLMYGTPRLFQV